MKTIKEVAGDLEKKSLFDLFAGTGAVGNHFNGKVRRVFSNDLEEYSFYLNYNLLINNKSFEQDFIWLNNLAPKEGFIWKHYSPAGGRMYFTEETAKKIDAIREQIFKAPTANAYKTHLLASLIESADRVANTASVYGAYLKDFKKSALTPFMLRPAMFKNTGTNNKVFKYDAEKIVGEVETDILYLDPPYNTRQYGANYHLLNTIVTKAPFEPQGITGLPPQYNKSTFCSIKTVEESLMNILANAKAKDIFLSYSNEGLLDPIQIKTIMKEFGGYYLYTKDYKRFKANSSTESNTVTEYLHYLRKK